MCDRITQFSTTAATDCLLLEGGHVVVTAWVVEAKRLGLKSWLFYKQVRRPKPSWSNCKDHT